MGQPYKECTACGARALKIATRCPGCHREFPRAEPAPAPVGPSAPGRSASPRPTGVAAGILVVAMLLIGTELGQSNASPSVTSMPTTDSAADRAEVGYVSNGGTVGAPAPAPPRLPALKVARTWTHVRKAPRKSAELEAVLTPGDTVLADSLQKGWYRVALDGEVLGYAYQASLAAADSIGSRGALTP